MDVSIGEVIQLVVGIAKVPSADPAQTEHVLRVALDGLGSSRKGRGVSDSLPGGVVHPLPADLRETLLTSSSALEAWHDNHAAGA